MMAMSDMSPEYKSLSKEIKAMKRAIEKKEAELERMMANHKATVGRPFGRVTRLDRRGSVILQNDNGIGLHIPAKKNWHGERVVTWTMDGVKTDEVYDYNCRESFTTLAAAVAAVETE